MLTDMSVSLVNNHGQKSSFVIITSHLTKKATHLNLFIWYWYIQVYFSKFCFASSHTISGKSTVCHACNIV